MRTLITLAWRNLWRNHRRTLIMLTAITVGCWAMIFMTAMMRGMIDDIVDDGIARLPGDIQIHHPDFRADPNINNSILLESKTLDQIRALPGVVHLGSQIRVPAVIASERESRGIELIGIDPAAAMILDSLELADGRQLESAQDKGLIIGRAMLKRLETRLGKRVVIMSQDPDNVVVDRGFRIVGVYSAELEQYEESVVFAGAGTLQNFLRLGESVSEYVIASKDSRELGTLADQIAALAPDWEVKDWRQLDPFLSATTKLMDGFVWIWIMVIFISLSFGLVNTLIMAVFERTREIGLIQALGMRPGDIVSQIVLETAFLLLLGIALGNAVAMLSIRALEDGLDVSAVAEGMAMMGASSVLYPAFYWSDLILANSVVLVLGIAASILPAVRAARMNPVTALNKT